ncbi:unnamed protein product [Urochloa humidicola]
MHPHHPARAAPLTMLRALSSAPRRRQWGRTAARSSSKPPAAQYAVTGRRRQGRPPCYELGLEASAHKLRLGAALRPRIVVITFPLPSPCTPDPRPLPYCGRAALSAATPRGAPNRAALVPSTPCLTGLADGRHRPRPSRSRRGHPGSQESMRHWPSLCAGPDTCRGRSPPSRTVGPRQSPAIAEEPTARRRAPGLCRRSPTSDLSKRAPAARRRN